MKETIAEEKQLEIVFEEIVEDNTLISIVREKGKNEKVRITWIEKQQRKNVMCNYEIPFITIGKTENYETGITTLYGYNSIIEYNGLGLARHNESINGQLDSTDLVEIIDFKNHKIHSSIDSCAKLYQELFKKKTKQKNKLK